MRDLQQQFCLKMLDFYQRQPPVEFIFIDETSCDPWRQTSARTWMQPTNPIRQYIRKTKGSNVSVYG